MAIYPFCKIKEMLSERTAKCMYCDTQLFDSFDGCLNCHAEFTEEDKTKLVEESEYNHQQVKARYHLSLTYWWSFFFIFCVIAYLFS